MKIFIPGGCGFIGSHLAEFYVARGDEVLVVDNLSSGTIQNIEFLTKNDSFTFEQADILSWPGLKEAVTWADVILHFAATVGNFNVIKDPISVVSSNIIGCSRLFRAMVETSAKAQVVIASSSSVYGNSLNALLSEGDDLLVKPLHHPIAPYAISKLADEALAYAYYKHYNIKVILARIFNTIGPRQSGRYGMVVPRFIEQACKNEPLTVFGDGSQTRSFCDVRDVVVAINSLIITPKAIGKSINIGNDFSISIKDLAKLIIISANSNSPIKYLSYEEAYGVPYEDIAQRKPDLSLLYSLIPFEHQWQLPDTIANLMSAKKQETSIFSVTDIK